jgi:pilus assembly protein CpaB
MSETSHQATNRSAIFGVIAVLIAAATAGGAWWVINSYQTALDIAKRPANTREVIAAARDIPPGEVITEDDLVLKRISVGDVAVDDLYGSEDELLGGAVSERILAGEPIRRQRLDMGVGLDDSLLEAGTRAVTLRVDRAAGVGGLIVPGSYVDVVVTIRPDENALDAKWVTETILQAVKVLAVGDNSVASVKPKATPATTKAGRKDADAAARSRELYATLEVEPEEVEKLAMATTRGDVYLSLRPQNDFDLLENTAPLVTNALVGIDAKPSPARAERLARRRVQVVATPPPAAPVGTQAEVISGSKTTVEHFGAQGEHVVDAKKK